MPQISEEPPSISVGNNVPLPEASKLRVKFWQTAIGATVSTINTTAESQEAILPDGSDTTKTTVSIPKSAQL